MKKFINDTDRFVDDFLAGFGAAHSDLVRVHSAPWWVSRIESPVTGKVAIVSGGGSGHEPLHVGFVGHGMLDAAVPGRVFTSPTPDPIIAACRAVSGPAGVLLIVKNYTGDVLNFETAADFASAEGITLESVLIADDVAVEDSSFTAGRRGVAGTMLVEKIAGAAAERGDDLTTVARIARHASGSIRSIGVALSAGVLPHSGESSFDLGDDEIEFGVGLHGEPGSARMSIENADALVDRMLVAITQDLPFTAGDRVLLFVNGLGGTPEPELYVVYRRAAETLAAQDIRIERRLVGTFVTSLDMKGVSITLLRLDDDLVELWDAPVRTAALRWGC